MHKFPHCVFIDSVRATFLRIDLICVDPGEMQYGVSLNEQEQRDSVLSPLLLGSHRPDQAVRVSLYFWHPSIQAYRLRIRLLRGNRLGRCVQFKLRVLQHVLA